MLPLLWLILMHFNSQPREETDGGSHGQSASTAISTHSLTRRLTFTAGTVRLACSISTHSLTRRLTIPRDNGISIVHISTHSLTRRLTDFSERLIAKYGISTHSLTRRLTVSSPPEVLHYRHFNSQPHEEADDCEF